jgi:N-methylhydantoinase A
LRDADVTAELLVMQSSGGVFTFTAAREKPVFMVESGPAAGVMAATYLGGVLGHTEVISFDMGGTTAKAGLIHDGRPRVTKEYEVGAIARASGGATRGNGSLTGPTARSRSGAPPGSAATC